MSNYFIDPDAGTAGAALGTGRAGAGRGGSAGSGTLAGGSTSGGSGGRGGGGAPGSGAGGGTAGQSTGCVPEPERCDGISNDCDDEIDEGSVCPDSCRAKYYDGHTYVLCVSADEADALGADDASGRCADLGVQFGLELGLGLAWIESSAENEVLKDWIIAAAPSDGVVWMGANDQVAESTWVWGRRAAAEQFFISSSDGGDTPYMNRFSDFGSGQPGSSRDYAEDCGAFDARVDWQWSDRVCDEVMPGFVCEEHPAQAQSSP